MKYHMLNVIIFLELSSVLVIQAVKTPDPFYIIAHMTNTKTAVDWALQQGANALETDIQFDISGNPTSFYHGDPCDCICALTGDHICNAVYGKQCDASNNAADHLQYIATRDAVALLYIDSKVQPSWGSRLKIAGEAIIPFIDSNLMAKGFKGKVIISAAKIASYDYIQAVAIAANNSPFKARYFITLDEEFNSYTDVIAMLSRLSNNRVYSTGASGCLPVKPFHPALQASVTGKNAGEHGMTIIWTEDLDIAMEKFISMGVNAIITNRVIAAKQKAISMGLTLANPSSSVPVSTKDIPSPNKCSCEYENGGCSISFPAPSNKACKCTRVLFLPSCIGTVVSCNTAHPKCAQPDVSKEACLLPKGNCAGYIA